jgi:MFS superfamily sulfate permease-like transporter
MLMVPVGPDDFRDMKRYSDARAVPGVIVYRFSGTLLFFNCGLFRKRVEELVETFAEPLHGFILDASAIFEVDFVACEALSEFHEKLHKRGIRLVIANLRDDVQDRLMSG